MSKSLKTSEAKKRCRPAPPPPPSLLWRCFFLCHQLVAQAISGIAGRPLTAALLPSLSPAHAKKPKEEDSPRTWRRRLQKP